MDLGDKVKAVTDAIGIKQCAGCVRRQEALNQLSRRGFIGSMSAFGAMLKVRLLCAPRSVMSDDDFQVKFTAVKALRFINTIEHWNYGDEGRFIHPTEFVGTEALEDLLGSQKAEKAGIGSTFYSTLNLSDLNRFAPGWSLLFANDPASYAAYLHPYGHGLTAAFSTDERAGIYEGSPMERRTLSLGAGAESLLRDAAGINSPAKSSLRIRQVLAFFGVNPAYPCSCQPYDCCCVANSAAFVHRLKCHYQFNAQIVGACRASGAAAQIQGRK